MPERKNSHWSVQVKQETWDLVHALSQIEARAKTAIMDRAIAAYAAQSAEYQATLAVGSRSIVER